MEWNSEGVMYDESGESMELMEEVPLKELGEAELERFVRGWRREAGSWFQRWGEAYWKERSVIRREDDVDGRASLIKDGVIAARRLNCDEVMQIYRLGCCENFVGKWEELVFNAFSYL